MFLFEPRAPRHHFTRLLFLFCEASKSLHRSLGQLFFTRYCPSDRADPILIVLKLVRGGIPSPTCLLCSLFTVWSHHVTTLMRAQRSCVTGFRFATERTVTALRSVCWHFEAFVKASFSFCFDALRIVVFLFLFVSVTARYTVWSNPLLKIVTRFWFTLSFTFTFQFKFFFFSFVSVLLLFC